MSKETKDTSTSTAENDRSDPPTNSQPAEPDQPVPTIITYPEFLLRRRSRAPPLLTPSGVLNTLYVAGGIMATIYGASTYMITPMMASLNEARLSLAGTALANLKRLNSLLENSVSEIPVEAKQHVALGDELHGGRSETSSVSDPTELFHVDVGTQTSPVLSRPLSPSNGMLATSTDGLAALSHQETRLKDLHSYLSDVVEVTDEVGDADAAVADSVRELSTYLDSLIDSSLYYGSSHVYGGLLGGSGSLNRGQSTTRSDDAVTTIKAEIRGIKGVLLSARNFPALGGRAGGRTGVTH